MCILFLHISSLINCFQHRDTDHGGVADSVVDHGVHTHRHRVSRQNLASRVTCHVSHMTYGPHLLGRNIEADGPEVDLLVGVDAGHDEEEARALGAPRPQPPQPEDDGSLVLLHHLQHTNMLYRHVNHQETKYMQSVHIIHPYMNCIKKHNRN